MENKIDSAFLFKRGTLTRWEELNPVLEKGEPAVGYEVDENENIISYVFKIGDGSKTWTELAAVASSTNIELSEENFEYELSNLVNAYIVLGPPQEDGTRLPAAGMLYSTYGLGDTPGAIEEYDVTDHLVVEGKSSYAVGRNIKILDDPTAEKVDERIANYATAFGAHHNISGYGSFTSGVNNDVTSHAKYGFTAGNQLFNNGSRAVAFGEGTNRLSKILSNNNLTVADIANLSSEDFMALLNPNRVSVTWGDYSLISGRDNIAFGKFSSAIGEWLYAGGDYSTVFGYANKVLGNKSAAFGEGNTVKASTSLALGYQNNVEGEGYSTVIGSLNNVDGKYSLTAGYKNTNNGDGTVALGWQNIIGDKTSGQGSVVTGKDNIVDSGYAFATGTKSYAGHYGSNVLGMGLKSVGQNATVVGQFNESKKDILFAVGNGEGAAADLTLQDNNTFKDGNNVKRSNALEVYKDGHAEVKNVGETENSVPTKKYVDDKFAENISGVVKDFGIVQHDTEVFLYGLSQPTCPINAWVDWVPVEHYNQLFDSEMVSNSSGAWTNVLTLPEAKYTTDPFDDSNSVLQIGAFEASDANVLKYYKKSMNLEIGKTYCLTLRVYGKIAVSLVGSNGIGEGSGWVEFDSPNEWKYFTHKFTCVGRSSGTAENPGWTMGFGLQKGKSTNGAYIDNVYLTPAVELEERTLEGELVSTVVADPLTGQFPTIMSTQKDAHLILLFEQRKELYGNYVQGLEGALKDIKAIDVVYGNNDGVGSPLLPPGELTVEETLRYHDDYIDGNKKQIDTLNDRVTRLTAEDIKYATKAAEYNVVTVDEALSYLFDNMGKTNGISIDVVSAMPAEEVAQLVKDYVFIECYEGICSEAPSAEGNTIVFEYCPHVSNCYTGIQQIDSNTLTHITNGNQASFNGYALPSKDKILLKKLESRPIYGVDPWGNEYETDEYELVEEIKTFDINNSFIPVDNTIYLFTDPNNSSLVIAKYLYKDKTWTKLEEQINIEDKDIKTDFTGEDDCSLLSEINNVHSALNTIAAKSVSNETHYNTLNETVYGNGLLDLINDESKEKIKSERIHYHSTSFEEDGANVETVYEALGYLLDKTNKNTGSKKAEDIVYDNTDGKAPGLSKTAISVENAIDTLAINAQKGMEQIETLNIQTKDNTKEIEKLQDDKYIQKIAESETNEIVLENISSDKPVAVIMTKDMNDTNIILENGQINDNTLNLAAYKQLANCFDISHDTGVGKNLIDNFKVDSYLGHHYIFFDAPLYPGEYTLSGQISGTICYENGNTTQATTISIHVSEAITFTVDANKFFSVSFTSTESIREIWFTAYVDDMSNVVGSNSSIESTNLQLEHGLIATEYEPFDSGPILHAIELTGTAYYTGWTTDASTVDKMHIDNNKNYVLAFDLIGDVACYLNPSQVTGEVKGWQYFSSHSNDWKTQLLHFSTGTLGNVNYLLGFGCPPAVGTYYDTCIKNIRLLEAPTLQVYDLNGSLVNVEKALFNPNANGFTEVYSNNKDARFSVVDSNLQPYSTGLQCIYYQSTNSILEGLQEEIVEVKNNQLTFETITDGNWAIQMLNGQPISAGCLYRGGADEYTTMTASYIIPIPEAIKSWNHFVATYNDGVYGAAMVSCANRVLNEDSLKITLYIPEGQGELPATNAIISIIAHPL